MNRLQTRLQKLIGAQVAFPSGSNPGSGKRFYVQDSADVEDGHSEFQDFARSTDDSETTPNHRRKRCGQNQDLRSLKLTPP